MHEAPKVLQVFLSLSRLLSSLQFTANCTCFHNMNINLTKQAQKDAIDTVLQTSYWLNLLMSVCTEFLTQDNFSRSDGDKFCALYQCSRHLRLNQAIHLFGVQMMQHLKGMMYRACTMLCLNVAWKWCLWWLLGWIARFFFSKMQQFLLCMLLKCFSSVLCTCCMNLMFQVSPGKVQV